MRYYCPLQHKCKQWHKGSASDSVGRVVASNSRDPWFESSHRQNLYWSLVYYQLYWKEKKGKRTREWLIFKKQCPQIILRVSRRRWRHKNKLNNFNPGNNIVERHPKQVSVVSNLQSKNWVRFKTPKNFTQNKPWNVFWIISLLNIKFIAPRPKLTSGHGLAARKIYLK